MKKPLLLILINLIALSIYAQDWEAVGSGTNGRVLSMIEYNGDLIVGGYFTEAGGNMANCVARWDGTEWHAMGSGFAGEVFDFEIYGGWLYASGWFFNDPNEVYEYQGIARWTGNEWSPVLEYDVDGWGAEIYDMLVYNDQLYITNHSMVGAEGVTRISVFNGSSWMHLPGNFTHELSQGRLYSLEVHNNQIVAGGWFDAIDSEPVKSVASFNSTNWESINMISSGINDKVYSLLSHNNELYAAGIFFDPFYTTLQKYDGTSWAKYQMDVDGNVWDIQNIMMYQGHMFVSGVFYYSDGPHIVSACTILEENSDDYQWADLNFFNDNSTQWIGFDMCEYNGDLYLGGDFQYAGSQDDPKNNIARFNGQIPTAVEEVERYQVTQVFPNPTNDDIHFNIDFTDEYQIMIYDLSGKLIKNGTLKKASFNVQDLEQGIYHVQLISKNENYSSRFIKGRF